ncbi:tryptamine benzoyltransferase 1-like [Triticum dicoccoides]|uniref:tryptamine benzoyltransferase 1-like n=1 Tax=Triticum dicoccoides TaxID=85692 RepID=UPI00188EBA91|nr:tryptamine benzoyltransferase 1-like [Triticum dicoccoides]
MEMTSSMMVKPVPHPLVGEKVALTVFDRAAADVFVPTVLVYLAPAPSNEALTEGLLKTVAPYPHLTGRLTVDQLGRRFLHVNNEGVLLIETTVQANLADVLVEDRMTTRVDHLYPTIPEPEENNGEALLQIQLNRYRCGGLVIGICSHHRAADGLSMSMFFTAWATAVREGDDFTMPTPFLDRAKTAVPQSPPTPVFDNRSLEFTRGDGEAAYAVIPMDRIKNLTVHFTAKFVADLKARVGARCSTFQCLLAHVWRKITAARALKPEEFTKVRVAVNCRGRADPPVPLNFFGNMVLWAFPRLQVRDLMSSSYGSVVGAIRDAVARIDSEYVQSFVDFGGVADANGEELVAAAAPLGSMFCPDAEVDSWLGFSFHQLDFGTGAPAALLPPDLPVEGLMFLVPSHKAKGGVDLFMAVAEEHVAAFEQICYCLD